MKWQPFALIPAAVWMQTAASNIAFADGGNVRPVQAENQILKTPDYTGDFPSRSTITGDWGGSRQDLANHGVTLDANLTQVTQGVTSGGKKSGWEYMGRAETTLNFDTTKMGLWPGGLLTIMGEGNFGSPLTPHTGALLGVNANDLFPEVENRYVLPQVSLTQFFSPQVGIQFGKLATLSNDAGDMNEFAHGKGAKQFLNPVMNINPISALTVPYSTLGVIGIYLPFKELVISGGVIDPHGVPNEAGFDKLFENGATTLGEARYTTNFLDMKGHQLVGVTYSTSSYTDLDQRASNLIFPFLPIQEASSSWNAYWNMDQYIYQPDASSERGIGTFARFGISDGSANPIHEMLSVGLSGRGLIPGREEDQMGLGYYYIWSSDTRITQTAGFEDAQGFEAYYEMALTPSIHLTPDFQWIQPSQDRVDSSWVTGLRLYTAF